ncbi:MAG: translation elongation factor Ts [Abditibacteriales bacterium]|nr:translation elongation factor Ts [Abditibacteriales bacterium]MDW8365079.1 translation elongation factor Ts [Abditibacteriales bacterium]
MSIAIDAASVMKLREQTGAGVMECKRALQDAQGNVDKAVELLRERGLLKAAKKAGRAAKEGRILTYVHHDGKTAAMVELNCETDFVARNELFQTLGRDIAMHVAARAPQFISKDDVPTEVLENEKRIYRTQAMSEGKPESVAEKIAEGRLNKFFFQEVCLLEQPFVKDEGKTIRELIQEHIAKLGENIVVGRFVRFKVGEAS